MNYRKTISSAILTSAALLAPAALHAGGGVQDVEHGLPVTVESAYTIDYLAREVQIVSRYERTDDGGDVFRIEPRFEYGIWWNTELSIAAPFAFGDVESDGNQTVDVELVYNINQETLDLPAISFGGGVLFPTGSSADGYDPFATVLITKTLGRSAMFHQLHLNFTLHWNDDIQSGERATWYEAAIGYSRRISTSALFVIDFVREQGIEDNVEHNLIEAGLRYQLMPQMVVSGGLGFGIGDESPDVRATFGVQYEF